VNFLSQLANDSGGGNGMQTPDDNTKGAAIGLDDFDFDTWMQLYKTDPEAFECRREALIKDAISSAPVEQQRRLNGLQFQIDMERRRSNSALQGCMRISSMMWKKCDQMRGKLNELSQQRDSEVSAPTESTPNLVRADVLEFSPR
jgi:hypothetical protein